MPDKVLAEKDPIATALFKKYNGVSMPNLRLSKVDAEALVKYLNDASGASEASAAPSTNAEIINNR
jgi:protein SCO1/2